MREWCTSTRSTGNGECVEVAVGPTVVGVRDSKNRSGPQLWVSVDAWRRFVNHLTERTGS